MWFIKCIKEDFIQPNDKIRYYITKMVTPYKSALYTELQHKYHHYKP